MQSKSFTLLAILALVFGAYSAGAQTPFFTEIFSDETASLANWVSGGDNEGTETWNWTDDPAWYSDQIPAFSAPTADNGFMYFNSDQNGFNMEHAVTLTSPVIDCSGKNTVFLEMYTQYLHYSGESVLEIGVSTNGTDFVYREVLDDVDINYVFTDAQRVVLELPEAINQDTVYLQVKWTGSYEYFLNIDDIALYETSPLFPNDLAVLNPRLPAAYATPLSQVDSMFFFGMARNDGADPQTNTHLRVTVIDPDENQVYQDSSEKTDMLLPGAVDTLFIENGFLPETVGQYFVNESVNADEDDDFTSNNRYIYDFVVSNRLYSNDNGVILSATQPDGISGDFWGGGNLYFVKNGEGYEADSARFVVAANESLEGESVTILLYKIEEDENLEFTDDDVEVVGFANYSFTAEDENFAMVAAPLFREDGITEGVPLEDSTEYILMLSMPPGVFLAYSYRNVIYDVSSIVKNGDDWFLGGFTGPLALVVRMTIREGMVDAAKEPELADSRITSFPNPTRDFYRIDLDLENASPVQLQLMSVSGQVVLQREYTSLQKDRIELDLSDLAAGAYLVKVRTEEGVKTLKLTKQ